jgi:6-phosphogluconate dehydrogenase
LVIDGGNSHYTQSVELHKLLTKHKINFMDIGVSGGPAGALNGACLMIGGRKEDYERLLPLIKILSAPNAYSYLGLAGSGHFAKMVHNGIEYGMMQALAEGAAILEASPFKYDLAKVFDLYNHNSVIESRLVGWAKNAFVDDPRLSKISSIIAHTGEGEWTVQAAQELKIDVPIIKQSLQVRKKSSNQPESFRNKVVSALRGQFGGHLVTKK